MNILKTLICATLLVAGLSQMIDAAEEITKYRHKS